MFTGRCLMWGNPIWRSILIQIMHLLLTRFVCSFHTSSNTLRRPHNFEKISQHYLQFSLLFSNVKKRLFPTFVAFSECQNFTNVYEYFMNISWKPRNKNYFSKMTSPLICCCVYGDFFLPIIWPNIKKIDQGLGGICCRIKVS